MHHTRSWGAMLGQGDRDRERKTKRVSMVQARLLNTSRMGKQKMFQRTCCIGPRKKNPGRWAMSLVPHGERIKENLPQDAFASPNRKVKPMHLATQHNQWESVQKAACLLRHESGRATSCLTPAQQKYCNLWHFGIGWAHVNQLQVDMFVRLDRPLHRWCGNFVTMCSVAASVFLCRGKFVCFFFRISFTSVPSLVHFPIVEPHHAGNRIPPIPTQRRFGKRAMFQRCTKMD